MEKIFILNLKLKAFLVLDNTTTHKTSKVKNKIKECEAALLVFLNYLT